MQFSRSVLLSLGFLLQTKRNKRSSIRKRSRIAKSASARWLAPRAIAIRRYARSSSFVEEDISWLLVCSIRKAYAKRSDKRADSKRASLNFSEILTIVRRKGESDFSTCETSSLLSSSFAKTSASSFSNSSESGWAFARNASFACCSRRSSVSSFLNSATL